MNEDFDRILQEMERCDKNQRLYLGKAREEHDPKQKDIYRRKADAWKRKRQHLIERVEAIW